MVKRQIRRFSTILLFTALMLQSLRVMGQSLNVRIEGDRIRVGTGRTRILSGDPLQRLHDGASVSYTLQLSAVSSRNGSVLARAEFRFVVSYDIFEEKFQVSRVLPSTRVLSHLSTEGAETALIEAMELPIPAIGPEEYFRIRWEYRADDMAQPGDPEVNLGGLVEIFSRKNSRTPVGGIVISGELRLRDLPRATPARGGANP